MSEERQTVEFAPAEGVRIEVADWEARARSLFASLDPDDEDISPADVAQAFKEFYLRDAQQVSWIYDGSTWTYWTGQAWAVGRPAGPLRLLPFTLEVVPQADELPPHGVTPLDQTTDAFLPDDPGVPRDGEDFALDGAPGSVPIAESRPASVAPATVIAAGAAPAPASPPVESVAPSAPSPAPAAPVAVPAAAAWATPATPVAAVYRRTHTVPAVGMPVWSAPDGNAAPISRLDPNLDVMLAEQHPNGWARIVCSNGWGGWVDGRLLIPG